MNNISGISTHYYQNNYQNVSLNGKKQFEWRKFKYYIVKMISLEVSRPLKVVVKLVFHINRQNDYNMC